MIKLKTIIKETMFPKEFDRHTLGSCMAAAALATDYLLKRGIQDFSVVEGWVSLYPDQEEEDWSTHTWIKFKNGRVFDPTRKQWKQWGFNPDDVEYMKIKKSYTPEEYQQVCRRQPDDLTRFKKSVNESPDGFDYKEKYVSVWTPDNRIAVSIIAKNANETSYFGYLYKTKEFVTNSKSLKNVLPTNVFKDYDNDYGDSITTHGELQRAISSVTGRSLYLEFERASHSRLYRMDDGQMILTFWEKMESIKPHQKVIEDMITDMGFDPKKMLYEVSDYSGEFFQPFEVFGHGEKKKPTTDDETIELMKQIHLNADVKRMLLKMPPNRLQRVADKLNIPVIKLNHLMGKEIAEELNETVIKPDVRSQNFNIKFGMPGVSKVAGKIFLKGIWFANTYMMPEGYENEGKWVINRHTLAFDMDLPSQNPSFERLEDLLDYLEKWYVSKKDKKLDETMTYKDLMSYVDDGRKERAANVKARSIPVSVENNNESWNFRYKSNPSVTDQPFQGQIQFLKEVKSTDDAQNIPVKVDCGCPDFKFRFAYNDTAQDASELGPDSLNKAINRKPKPAYDYGVGLCKHLVALKGYLQTKIAGTKKSNLFEALDEISKTRNFNVEYTD